MMFAYGFDPIGILLFRGVNIVQSTGDTPGNLSKQRDLKQGVEQTNSRNTPLTLIFR